MKRAKNGKQWHPHLHILAEGSYIWKLDLRAEWLRITSDSYVIDVRKVRDENKAFEYVTKYASKPLGHAATRQPDALLEAMAALAGRRLVTTFGTCRGLKLVDQGTAIDWIPVRPLNELIHEARTGRSEAAALLATLRKDWSCQSNHQLRPP